MLVARAQEGWHPRAMTAFGPLQGTVVGQGDKLLIVLMHGFGAPGDDLVPLAGALNLPEARFVFLEAPEPMPPPYPGRMWWMIDVGRFENAMRTGALDALEKAEPEGLSASSRAVAAALRAVRERFPAGKMVVGGFSQGSMVALDVAASTDVEMEALVLLSSTLMARSRWFPALQKRENFPCFQSHGTEDPVLPFVQAQRLRAELESAGVSVDWHSFTGGHGIPPETLASLQNFLSRL